MRYYSICQQSQINFNCLLFLLKTKDTLRDATAKRAIVRRSIVSASSKVLVAQISVGVKSVKMENIKNLAMLNKCLKYKENQKIMKTMSIKPKKAKEKHLK